MDKVKQTPNTSKGMVDALFSVGAHFGFVKSRRHPSVKQYIYGSKNSYEIFDLEKTQKELEKALIFIEEKGRDSASGLWVGGKSEAREAIEKAGLELEMPYVAGRWIGGTLSNFTEIKKRILRLEELLEQKKNGELSKYTKKEHLLVDRKIEKLTIYFGGLSQMRSLPKFIVVIDPKKEYTAVAEARKMHIPIIALAGSDTNLYELNYAIPGNDASRQSIGFITEALVKAYSKGKIEAANKKAMISDEKEPEVIALHS